MWTVTRQLQWPDGNYVVEISRGNYEYVNSGELERRFPGEGETYLSAVKAVEIAIAIRDAWEDLEEEEISIAMGHTGGGIFPLEPQDTEDLLARAKELDAVAEKCGCCGEILSPNKRDRYKVYDSVFDDLYCSEHCATLAWSLEIEGQESLDNEFSEEVSEEEFIREYSEEILVEQ